MMHKVKKIIIWFYLRLKLLIRLNITKTLYINFKTQPLKAAFSFPILVYGKLRINSLKGKIIFDTPIELGLLQIGIEIDDMPISTNPSKIEIDGTLIIKGRIALNHSTGLFIDKDSKVEFGNQVMICSGVVIKSEESITIKDDVVVASGCFIMDTNMHSIRDVSTGRIKKRCGPIIIGKGCWLTMNTSIMSGSVLPDYCITARSSFINKDYTKICEKGSLLAGSPASVVAKNKQKVFDYELEHIIKDYFKLHPESDLFESRIIGFADWDKKRIHPVFRIFK